MADALPTPSDYRAWAATDPDPERAARAVRAAEGMEAGTTLVVYSDLLRSLVCDDDPCWFDHHGGCQAHGYLSLEPGEVCPQAEAKRLLGMDP